MQFVGESYQLKDGKTKKGPMEFDFCNKNDLDHLNMAGKFEEDIEESICS